MPELKEAYPSVFNEEMSEEQKQEQLDELSAMRFRMFANSFNKKMQKGGNEP